MNDDSHAPTESGPEAIRALAADLGVIDRYHDAFGTLMEVPDDSLRDACAALGQPVADGADAARRLAERRAALWTRPLPASLVLRRDDPAPTLPLVWPTAGEAEAATGDPTWGRWRIDLEEGRPKDEVDADAESPPLAGDIDPDALVVLETGPEGRRRLSLPLPTGLPLGYHRLHVWLGGESEAPAASCPLIVAPSQCWLPEGWQADDGPRLWGVSCQVHGLRGRADWGMGDFDQLGRLARLVGREGGDILGVNPLHALFATRPLHASPYSPNSRLFLNPLYIAISAVPEAAETPEISGLEDDLDELRAPDLIALDPVATHKHKALEALFATFARTHLGRRTARGKAFAAFVKDGGDLLERFAMFQILSEQNADREDGWSWRSWPEHQRTPEAAKAAGLAESQTQRLHFHLWCQFEADRQLGEVAEAARAAGQRLGLYRDLALGSDPSGADCWAMGDMMVDGLAVGAPPDPWNAKGQNWGFPTYHPERLKAAGYEPFARMIRANMRHAGALRMDHVLGLLRLFCIPRGREGREGLYLRMPLEELLGVLALESHRARCLVIGEDLGTVPDGFRARMQQAAILSCRMFYFERHADRSLKPPMAYPRLAAVAASSHDLPTLAGFWAGRDLAWKNDLDLFPTTDAREAESMERHFDRPRIREALARDGLPLDAAEGFDPPANLVPAVTDWTAATPSLIVMVQIEDVVEEREQANLPGTLDTHPNWRRRVAVAVEDLEPDGRLDRLARLIAERDRGRAAAPSGEASAPS